MPVTARISAAIGLVAAIVIGLNSWLDIQLSALFYDSSLRDFPIGDMPLMRTIRWVLMHLPHLITVATLVALLAKVCRLPFASRLPTRPALFLLSTLLVIPGLVVNAGLKENWGRPRPHHTAMFGGDDRFYPWWKPGGPCEDNCSFVSGEVSGAAWMAAAAAIAPPQYRMAAFGITLAVTAATGVLRMAFGGHWFSDVVLSAALTFFLIAVMHRLFFGPGLRPVRGGARRPQQEIQNAV
jgi:lipid A 4'-phosphatase